MAKLFLVDVENICKNPVPSALEVEVARKLIIHRAGGDPENDFFVLGTHIGLKTAVLKAWPQTNSQGEVNRVAGFFDLGRSQDQAGDRVLSAWLKLNESKLGQWKTVVIASGDHHFVADARNLLTRGKKVSILSLSPSNMSKELKKIKKANVIYITDLSPVFHRGFRGLTLSQVESWIMSGAFPKIEKTPRPKIKEKVAKPKVAVKTSLKWNPEVGAKALLKTAEGQLTVKIWNSEKDWLSDDYLFVNSDSKVVRAVLGASIGGKVEFAVDGKAYQATLISVVNNRTFFVNSSMS